MSTNTTPLGAAVILTRAEAIAMASMLLVIANVPEVAEVRLYGTFGGAECRLSGFDLDGLRRTSAEPVELTTAVSATW